MFLLMLAIPVAAATGVFETAADVGAVQHKGSAVYDPAGKVYRITGSGANIWANTDSFQFLYRKIAGDVTMTTGVEFPSPGGNGHKKAGVMLRSGLAADDAYADVLVHGDGTIGFQYRSEKGGTTREVKTAVRAPVALRLHRNGDVISAEVARRGGPFQVVGALPVALGESIYAGLVVCAHEASATETAVFSNVAVDARGKYEAKSRAVVSTLETMDVETGERRIVRRAREHFEAPNWTRDGRWLYYNGGGNIYRIGAAGGTPQHISTGEIRVNNDHGLSPDGKLLAISGRPGAQGQSQVFVTSAEGGVPRLVTALSPSYWHGWSPDGKTLAYCAQRNGNFDIYTIGPEGGEERRLTVAEGLDDGPEYSPDGRYIYFNSERTGLMRIWRMKADGSEQQMISQGPESADWFAHPSPDGKWIVYISYDKSVKGHPANKDVTLKLAPAGGGEARVIATLFGGQGTMNVPSWSPDSKQIAFVSYQLEATPEAQIRTLLDRQAADWNRGDVKAFMETYEESDGVTFVGKAITKGHGKVLANYIERYPAKENMGATRFEILEVNMLGAHYANVLGRYFLTRTEQAGGNAQGVFTLILKETASGWRIIQDHTSN